MPYEPIPPAGPDRPPQATNGRGSFRLTKHRFENIVELVGMGNYIEVACTAAGLTARSYHRYLERGRQVQTLVDQHLLTNSNDDQDDDVLDELTDAWKTTTTWPVEPPSVLSTYVHANDWTCWLLWRTIEKAQAESEAYAVLQVRRAMTDNWAAAMTFLERTRPGRWRRRDSVEVRPALDAAEAAEEERALDDGAASRLLHAALARAAGVRALPEVVEGEAVVVDDGGSTGGG